MLKKKLACLKKIGEDDDVLIESLEKLLNGEDDMSQIGLPRSLPYYMRLFAKDKQNQGPWKDLKSLLKQFKDLWTDHLGWIGVIVGVILVITCFPVMLPCVPVLVIATVITNI